jgi:hypothetical protein
VLTRVIVRHSWETIVSLFWVDGRETELVAVRRWVEFHKEAMGFEPSWGTYEC